MIMPPPPGVLPFVTVTALSVRFAAGFTKKTREAMLPEISKLLAPVELIIVNVPAVATLLIPSSPPVKVIVQTPPAVQPVSPAGMAKPIESLSIVAFALAIAPRKLQSFAAAVQADKVALSAVVSTVYVEPPLMVVGSVAVLLAVLVSPPPETVAVLVAEAGALFATLTVRVIIG